VTKKDKKPFTDVSFLGQFSPRTVAEHEVFMSFVNDKDAEEFGYWWNEKGAISFQKHLDKKDKQ